MRALDRWFEDRIDWTDDLLGLVVLVAGVVSLAWLVGCAPDRNSSAHDVHRYCVMRQYTVENSFAAEKRYDICMAEYGRP